MGAGRVLLVCIMHVCFSQGKVTMELDRPWLRVELGHSAILKCCFQTAVKPVTIEWLKWSQFATYVPSPELVNMSRVHVVEDKVGDKKRFCGNLTLASLRANDSGLYQCLLNISTIFYYTHGTYLQVFRPLEKTINLSEKTKNGILIAEGILILLCILLPSVALLNKSKSLNKLEKKKAKREEENIYQGLNLDDCCPSYDQIERSKEPSPYQDVENFVGEEGVDQLEKP